MATKQLTAQGFKDNIYDYTGGQDWHFKGKLPVIIDFDADWCGPCKTVAPVLEELSNDYAGRIEVYKIDTEKEQELSSLFGIQSIPTFLFIPLEGDPMLERGAFGKNVFIEIIETRMLAATNNSSDPAENDKD